MKEFLAELKLFLLGMSKVDLLLLGVLIIICALILYWISSKKPRTKTQRYIADSAWVLFTLVFIILNILVIAQSVLKDRQEKQLKVELINELNEKIYQLEFVLNRNQKSIDNKKREITQLNEERELLQTMLSSDRETLNIITNYFTENRKRKWFDHIYAFGIGILATIAGSYIIKAIKNNSNK